MKNTSNSTLLHHFRQLDKCYGIEKTVVDAQQLANSLFCTTRNVAKIMKSLALLGWINWQPGRGRGIKSTLQLQYSFDQILCQKLAKMVGKGELSAAYQFADIFHYQTTFKQKLPEWLAAMPNQYAHSDELISLVDYELPHCHPLYMKDINAGVYANALFDTLIKFDAVTQSFIPHLAHQFYQQGNCHYFRIRPDVCFHNGDLLTPEHIKANLLARQKNSCVSQVLFKSIKNININLQWVEVLLTHNEPIFLHALADIHSAIFLTNSNQQHYPFGTGAYQWDKLNTHHWSLIKNKHYFALHGVLKRADFWHVESNQDKKVAHLELQREQQNAGNNQLTQFKVKGCKALCLGHHLQDRQRQAFAWLIQYILKASFSQSKTLTNSLLDENIKTPQSSLDFNDPKLMKRTIKQLSQDIFRPFRYYVEDKQTIQALLIIMAEHGISIESVKEQNKADFWINDFLYGHNPILDHYYWLLCSITTKSLVSEFKRTQWLTEISHSANLEKYLQQIEAQYISQYRIIPMWKKRVAIKTDATLRGAELDSLGLVNLSELWFDKRH